MEKFEVDALNLFEKQWALVTAGNRERFNTMTIGWGGLGTLWNKPVATVYIKPVRYTYGFMEDNEYFTVSFYPEEYRTDMALLGRKSGRDTNKVALTKLTPVYFENGVSFKEAQVTLLCKKIYAQDLKRENIPQAAIDKYYLDEEPHRMYIGEIVEIIR